MSSMRRRPSLADYKPVAKILPIQPSGAGSPAHYVLMSSIAEARMMQDDLSRQLTDMRQKNSRMRLRAEGRNQNHSGIVHLLLAVEHMWHILAKGVMSALTTLATCFLRVWLVRVVYGGCSSCTSSATTLRLNIVGNEMMMPTASGMRRRGGTRTSKTATQSADEAKKLRKIAQTYVAEDKWEIQNSKGVWFPVHPLKQKWDFLLLLMIVYSCIMVPFRIGMRSDAVGQLWWFEFTVTLCFCTDLCFNFNTAYLSGPYWVIDRLMIAKNYARSWFVIDALSSFPVEIIDLVADSVGFDEDESNSVWVKVLRGLRMVRLLRLLKLLNINKWIDAIEDRFGMNMQILHILKMISMLLYLTHLLGCFWFYVATSAGTDVTWVREYDETQWGEDGEVMVQYLYSVYWALTTLTTVGYGDILAQNNAERWYAMGCLLLGALVFGYMLSSIGDLVSTIDTNAVKLDAKLDEVKDFTRWHKFTPELGSRVRRYFEYFYARKSAMDEESIVANLAPSLKREVVAHLLHSTVERIPMFSFEYCAYADVDFQLEVHPLLKPVVYEAGEMVVEKGSFGDDLYFLNKGTVAAATTLDERVLFPISDTGSFFGEHLLCGRPSDLPYRAITRSEFYCLAKGDLYELLDRNKHAREELAAFVFEDVMRHKMLRFWALRMSVNDVFEVDPRAAAALKLQVAWMKRQIMLLQAQRRSSESLEWLMPGIFGAELVEVPAADPRWASTPSTTFSTLTMNRQASNSTGGAILRGANASGGQSMCIRDCPLGTGGASVGSSAGVRLDGFVSIEPPASEAAGGIVVQRPEEDLTTLEKQKGKLEQRELALEQQVLNIQQALAQLTRNGVEAAQDYSA